MLNSRRAPKVLLALLFVIATLFTLVFFSVLSTDEGDASFSVSEKEPVDPSLLYEVYSGDTLLFTAESMHDFFSVSDKIESEMSEKLGYPYSISDDLDIEIVTVRKVAQPVSDDKIREELENRILPLYSECYALYVGNDIVGYCPLSESDELQQLAVDIIGYVSEHGYVSYRYANVYAALSYTHKKDIAPTVNCISSALLGTHDPIHGDNTVETVSEIIESIDNVILYGNSASSPSSDVEVSLSVSSIRRVENEVIPYEKLSRPDTYYGLKYGDDEDPFVHVKGQNGSCTVEYEDIYIGDRLAKTVRIDSSETVTKSPIHEITVYGTQSTKASGKFVWPTVGWVTSEYGKRDSEIPGMSSNHKGIDIATSSRTTIVAADAGKVIFAGYHSGGYGYCVIIDHENGIQTLYAHMYKKPLVSVGDRVYQGEALGGQGATGVATGVHLHFEVRNVDSNGNVTARVNPRKYLPEGYPPTKW